MFIGGVWASVSHTIASGDIGGTLLLSQDTWLFLCVCVCVCPSLSLCVCLSLYYPHGHEVKEGICFTGGFVKHVLWTSERGRGLLLCLSAQLGPPANSVCFVCKVLDRGVHTRCEGKIGSVSKT